MIISLLIGLLILAVVIWATRALVAAFGLPEPISTVIFVIVVVIAVLWFIGQIQPGAINRLW